MGSMNLASQCEQHSDSGDSGCPSGRPIMDPKGDSIPSKPPSVAMLWDHHSLKLSSDPSQSSHRKGVQFAAL